MALPYLSESPVYVKLQQLAEAAEKLSLRDLTKDAARNKRLSVKLGALFFDASRQLITEETLDNLLVLADERQVTKKIQMMFTGEKLNPTEGRAVLHVALRAPAASKAMVDGENVVPAVHEVLNRIKKFSQEIRGGERKGHTGKVLTDVVSIGIGGSYLGPEFVYEALRTEPVAKAAAAGRRLHFLANVDPVDVERALERFDPETTLAVIVSKTFTTAETMLNARTMRAWLLNRLKDESAIAKHMIACSSNIKATSAFGIAPENVFGFWDWVGGRYSVSSAVGVVPLALQYGFDTVQEFLSGAHDMDMHFQTAPFAANIPVLSGLVAHWNTVHLRHSTVAVLPYAQALVRFAAHIQQLNMESNGKGVTIDGKRTTYPTGPVIFGEPGTNGQHSFYQLMHQGHVVPAEFIGVAQSHNPIRGAGEAVSSHDELMSNFFAQPDALAFGKTAEEAAAEGNAADLVPHKVFSGNRPSTVLLMKTLKAYDLGALLALYEHRTAVEGFLLDINSFDQFGVELGKHLATNVRKYFAAKQAGGGADAETMKAALAAPTQQLLAVYEEFAK